MKKRNETKYNETKRKMKKRNETKYIKQSIKDPKTINEEVNINEILSSAIYRSKLGFFSVAKFKRVNKSHASLQ